MSYQVYELISYIAHKPERSKAYNPDNS